MRTNIISIFLYGTVTAGIRRKGRLLERDISPETSRITRDEDRLCAEWLFFSRADFPREKPPSQAELFKAALSRVSPTDIIGDGQPSAFSQFIENIFSRVGSGETLAVLAEEIRAGKKDYPKELSGFCRLFDKIAGGGGALLAAEFWPQEGSKGGRRCGEFSTQHHRDYSSICLY